MTQACIALGSNIDPEKNLQQAVHLLAKQFKLLARSRVYVTPPWGYKPQADFLNAALLVETQLEPLPVLDALLAIELVCGRERNIPNGPRTLDLDLIFHGETKFQTPRLTLPHPGMHLRGFVLVPMADIAPGWVHPDTGKSVAEMASLVETSDIRPSNFSLELPEGDQT